MRHPVLARWSGIVLGVIYVLLGVAETIRLFVTGDGGFVFWFGTLVGGGTLLLLGTLPRTVVLGRRRLVAIVVGAILGMPATAWTFLLPLLAVAVIALTVTSTTHSAGPA